ncbi:hypothetical protein ACFQ07_15195 [Actinomadura adrarensis]|uniref:Uncharacterized protein n=1 Tax=Actinomadura adrarensis TaxID=1819600 RepID=A0ABW3CGC3_9ACTN
MRLHPRTLPVQSAGAELKAQLIAFQIEHDLTNVEMLGLLQDAASDVTRRLLRAERHPNDPERKADEA